VKRLTRDTLLTPPPVKVERIEIPEWDCEAFVRVITGAERDALEAEITSNKGKVAPNFRGRFAALVLCHEDGSRIYTDKDAPHLGAQSATALSRILEVGMAFNRVGDSEVKAAVGESAGAPS
jgi:hypothetical protein